MKFEELTPEQQEHFLKMLEQVGEPPEGTTHVDQDYDKDASVWLKVNFGTQFFYSHSFDSWVQAGRDVSATELYQLPEKPWGLHTKKDTDDLSTVFELPSVTQLKTCCDNLLETIDKRSHGDYYGEPVVRIDDIQTQIDELVDILYGKDGVSK